ncbi:acetyl-CoA carboxylase biotin carboxylase subunit family protein [Streptomyces sp. NPDC008001]|uniref:ATP-grasp domain-containing protein n=1 Tax=Streptomyces sp. NPDC008001 TaxID=3364804 RepID=UPI0036E9EA2E
MHSATSGNETGTTAGHIVLVEAPAGGTGLRLVEAAVRKAGRVTLVTRDTGRYATEPLRHLLESGPVGIRVRETRSAEELTGLFQELRGEGEFALIAPDEQCLLPAAAAAGKLGIPFLPTSFARLARDRHAFRRACAAGSVPAPRSTAAPDLASALAAAEATGYPVVLKPSLGTGSHGVVLAADADELRWHFREVLEESGGRGGVPLVEEFLSGPVVSAEALYAGGTPHVLGVSDRIMSELPYFMELADRFPVDLSPEVHRRITGLCARLARLMGYENGPAHIEFALTADGPKVVEFTPRFAGRTVAATLSAALVRDVFDKVIASYLGEPVRAPAPVTSRRAAPRAGGASTTPSGARGRRTRRAAARPRPRGASGRSSATDASPATPGRRHRHG